MNHRELPMLAGIAGLIRWCEELVNLVSGPLLTLGLGLALIDLLTEGKLLTSWPILLYVWAITQAIGVDAQLVASWDRARIALREHRYWSLLGLLVLGLILAYVAWVASQVFALQQSEGLSTTAALTRLGMDSASWLIQRTALSVALVALAGWTRYHAPAANVALSAAEERERLEADLLLEPLRQQKRAMQVRGLRGVAAAAMGKETPAPVETPPAPSEAQADDSTRPPTGPGTPRRRKGVITPTGATAETGTNVVRLPSAASRPRRRKAASNRASGRGPRVSVESKVRAVWQPGMSGAALAREAHVGKSAASKWRGILSAEDAQAIEQTQEQAAQ